MDMGNSMNDGIAVFRTEEGMTATLNRVREIKDKFPSVGVHNKGRVFNTDLLSVLELGYMLDVAEVIAGERGQSQGEPRRPTRGRTTRTAMTRSI